MNNQNIDQLSFNHRDCLGVVLAGGLSSRMGQDKAQLMRKTDSMLEFSKQLLIDSGINQVVVSGNNHQVTDLVTNAGPVGGIYSVIKRYQPSAILVLPIDLPLMTASAIKKLRITGELSQKACFYQDHHIPLYLPNNGYLELFLAHAFNKNFTQDTSTNQPISNKKGPSVKALLAQIPHQALMAESPKLLFNSNTPQQWQHAQKQFNRI